MLRGHWGNALFLIVLLVAPVGMLSQSAGRGMRLPVESEEESRPLETEQLHAQAGRLVRRSLLRAQSGHLVLQSQIHLPSFAGQGTHSSEHSLLSTEAQLRNGFGGPLRC